MKKRFLSLGMAIVMMLSLSLSASAAAVNAPAQEHRTLRILTASQEAQLMALTDYKIRTGTVALNRNTSGTQGTTITSFVAENDTAIFKITGAPNTETYNVVCLDSEGGAYTTYYSDVPIGNPIAADNLIPGERYTFAVSSNDCPARGCTATYELKY